MLRFEEKCLHLLPDWLLLQPEDQIQELTNVKGTCRRRRANLTLTSTLAGSVAFSQAQNWQHNVRKKLQVGKGFLCFLCVLLRKQI